MSLDKRMQMTDPCAWCGEGPNDEQGPVYAEQVWGQYHVECYTALHEGALATQLAKVPDPNPHPECGHDEPNEHPACEHCWWNLTHDVDPDTGQVTELGS